jgi:hypothetical protein
VTNPFKEYTLQSIQREILNRKASNVSGSLIEVLPPTRVVKVTTNDKED